MGSILKEIFNAYNWILLNNLIRVRVLIGTYVLIECRLISIPEAFTTTLGCRQCSINRTYERIKNQILVVTQLTLRA